MLTQDGGHMYKKIKIKIKQGEKKMIKEEINQCNKKKEE